MNPTTVEGRDGTTLRVTHDFITRCFQARPAGRGT